MTRADWGLDGIVASAMPLLAWTVIRAPTLHRAVVLFVTLGLVSALAWTRLGAVDVALVEASIGAGLSGALFMSALSWAAEPLPAAPRARRLWTVVVTVALACALGPVVLGLPDGAGLTEAVSAELGLAGVSQPVTAVLMNYRGYDTLLETTVLLVAAISVRTLQAGPTRRGAADAPDLLVALADLMLPISILLSGYLVWRGSHGPGGAFQAGAVLSGGGVVFMLAGRMRGPRMESRVVRGVLLAGPAVFLVVAGAPLLAGRRLLEYPRHWAGDLIVAVESALSLSIALVLTMFFPELPTAPTAPDDARRRS